MAIKIKVSELLGKHKMSQKDLQNLTGIRYATIQAYYHETVKEIKMTHIEKLCKAFNCQPGDIFEYIPEEATEDE